MPFFRGDLDSIQWADERDMMRRIENGEQIWTPEEMTLEYFRLCADSVFRQGDSELSGGLGYWMILPVICQYSIEEYNVVCETAYEEFTHSKRCYEGILEKMGFDTKSWKAQHHYDLRLLENERLYAFRSIHNGMRPTQDGRVDIFYYCLAIPKDPLQTAIRFAVFQFLQDRGAGVQLKDALTSSFAPWAQENHKIMLEEQDHLQHGEERLVELNQEYPTRVDKEIKLWLPRVIATFGKPESETNYRLRKYGIVQRKHEEVLFDFLAGDEGIHTANERSNIGLILPATDEIMRMWRKGDYLKEI